MRDPVDHTPNTWLMALVKMTSDARHKHTIACRNVVSFCGENAGRYGHVLILPDHLLSFNYNGLPAPNQPNFWIGKPIQDLVHTAKLQLAAMQMMEHAKEKD